MRILGAAKLPDLTATESQGGPRGPAGLSKGSKGSRGRETSGGSKGS